MEQSSLPSQKVCTTRMEDLPSELRPREKLMAQGSMALTDAELLAILIGSGVQGTNAIQLAEEVLTHFGGIESMEKGTYHELVAARIRGLGPVRAVSIAAALEIARRWRERQKDLPEKDSRLTSPEKLFHYLYPSVQRATQESFWVVPVDVKLAPILSAPVEATRGVINASPCHPREVFAPAIRCGAANIYVAHNHPSGDPTPSEEDLSVTRRLIDAGNIVGIPVVDHLIIASGRMMVRESSELWVSLRRKGLVNFR